MRLSFRPLGGTVDLPLPPEGGAGVLIPVPGPCPACGAAEFLVGGLGKRPSHDGQAWEADARAECCGGHVGLLRIETDTLFGVREDRAMQRYPVVALPPRRRR